MQSPVPMSELLSAIAAGLGRGGVSSPGTGGWAVTVVSVLAVIAAGVAVRTGRRLTRRSAPELIVLLDQSAAFYGRWPEDRLSMVPRAELMREAARCRRIVELLEARALVPADDGVIAGLRAWITLLASRIDGPACAPSGVSYA